MISSCSPQLILRTFAAAAALLGCVCLRAADSPADPSFESTSDVIALSHSFGTFRQGHPGATFDFDVYNRAAPTGTTSAMSLVSTSSFGDSSAIALNTGTAQHVQPNSFAPMQLILTTNQPGNLEVIYTLRFASDTAAAPVHPDLAISAYATVLRRGDYNSDGNVDAADYVLWRKTLNQAVTVGTGADGNENGVIDQPDYNVWRANFTSPTGAGSSTANGLTLSLANTVPEPASCLSCLLGTATVCLFAGRRRRRMKDER